MDRDLARHDEMAGANLLTAVAGYFGPSDPAELNNTWEGRLTERAAAAQQALNLLK